ncbi:serine/threonine-protein kinase [Demetria terragena]|uniref:serine/threonine-protein kinase n=1 Tax=Demetria terragena TaxID=63959 RepID=UPI0009FD2373|nr:serine/threonine-protein kinase [Demetria terragena]
MGEVFAGRYELIDMIGEGGMGAVWRVRDLKRDRIVAAKVLRQSDAGSLLRFMREQGVRIHHPHVVTPLGWAGEDDQVLFTMPIVEGGSVADLLKTSVVLPPRYGAEILRQLLSALDAVHSAGVVHRDIKPANLLLDATGTQKPRLWLTDFGVALPVNEPRLTAVSMVMGTPGYLAPEQLRGAEPDPTADLYAAGMVGLQLATGHRPRPQMRTERLDLPPAPRDVPRPLWDLLIRLADPDPSGRPASARAALQELDDPNLTWQDQQAVNISRRMPDLTGVSEGEFLRPGEGDGTTPQSSASTTVSPQAATTHQPVGAASTSGKGRLLALVAAGVIAVGALGATWWPRSGESPAPDVAQQGGTCGWWDAGATARDADGTSLRCRAEGSTFTWQE